MKRGFMRIGTGRKKLSTLIGGLKFIPLLVMMGCNPVVPDAPTTTPVVGLTVRTLEFGTYNPIIGSEVYVDGVLAGLTDNTGSIRVKVPLGTFFDIDVFAKGFVSEDAGGIVRSEEVWTFWLYRIDDERYGWND